MMPDEKSQLLDLLGEDGTWCRDAEARNSHGEAVAYDNNAAVAWDITGALCRLFGWDRACVLFEQIERHIFGRRRVASWPERDRGIEAMKALQTFNDGAELTFAMLRAQLEALPVWQHGGRGNGVANGSRRKADQSLGQEPHA